MGVIHVIDIVLSGLVGECLWHDGSIRVVEFTHDVGDGSN